MIEIHHKAITPTGLKLDASRVRAVFSVFDRLDSDGDVIAAGAIPDGAEIILSSWNHGSWHPGVLPLGRGVVRTDATEATIDATIFGGTVAGRETLAVLDGLGDLCKWSFGFQILDHDFTTINGKRARLLTRLDVHEASPVLLAANDWTRTLSVGEADTADPAREYARFVRDELDRQITEEMTRIRENAA